MIVVIQCAAGKEPNAGYLRQHNGQKVTFVADPDSAPKDDYAYARPDDLADTGISWRKELFKYNDNLGDNPQGLLPAWKLYKNSTYECLYRKYGSDYLYILSAGWGLISADFLTPVYDITFSQHADNYKRRDDEDRYDDFRMLPTKTTENIVFFGSQKYVGPFCALTAGVKGSRHVWYATASEPDAPGCILHKYPRTFSNWQYQCARDFMEGKIQL